MSDDTVKFVQHVLVQVELLVLATLQAIRGLSAETSSVRVVLTHTEEDGVKIVVLTPERGEVYNFSHPCPGDTQWRHIICLRVESILTMGNTWEVPRATSQDGELTIFLNRPNHDAETCLSEADRSSIEASRGPVVMPRLMRAP
jgi:hypothetical protein